MCLFGDRPFFLEDCVIGAYRSQNGIALTEGEPVFNPIWQAKDGCGVGFSKLMQLLQLTDLKLMLKYGLSPIASYVLFVTCQLSYLLFQFEGCNTTSMFT